MIKRLEPLVAIHEGILDDYRPPIDRRILLRLILIFPNIPNLFSISRQRMPPSWDSYDMAREEVFRPGKVGVEGVGLTIFAADQDFGRRDEEDVVTDRLALRRQRTSEEGAQVWVEWLHSGGRRPFMLLAFLCGRAEGWSGRRRATV